MLVHPLLKFSAPAAHLTHATVPLLVLPPLPSLLLLLPTPPPLLLRTVTSSTPMKISTPPANVATVRRSWKTSAPRM